MDNSPRMFPTGASSLLTSLMTASSRPRVWNPALTGTDSALIENRGKCLTVLTPAPVDGSPLVAGKPPSSSV